MKILRKAQQVARGATKLLDEVSNALESPKSRPKSKYIRVYHIKFKDGAEYIGQTRRTLKARMWHHEHQPCNRGVQSRLLKKMPYTITQVSRHISASKANQAEINLIWERDKVCKKVLNRRGLDMKPIPTKKGE